MKAVGYRQSLPITLNSPCSTCSRPSRNPGRDLVQVKAISVKPGGRQGADAQCAGRPGARSWLGCQRRVIETGPR